MSLLVVQLAEMSASLYGGAIVGRGVVVGAGVRVRRGVAVGRALAVSRACILASTVARPSVGRASAVCCTTACSVARTTVGSLYPDDGIPPVPAFSVSGSEPPPPPPTVDATIMATSRMKNGALKASTLPRMDSR
ncbi:MAG: hypothetical protein IH959_07930 [Chloroflexi bacterium]|nr:hypothetical protein [Chloroflexota bacterium]